MFLVVADEVLQACDDVFFLDSIAICTRECAREQGILRVRLETYPGISLRERTLEVA
jgi:hypothetical protein